MIPPLSVSCGAFRLLMVARTRGPQRAQSRGLAPSPSFKEGPGLGEGGRTSPAPAKPARPTEQWPPLTGGAAHGARGDVTRSGRAGGRGWSWAPAAREGRDREGEGDLGGGVWARARVGQPVFCGKTWVLNLRRDVCPPSTLLQIPLPRRGRTRSRTGKSLLQVAGCEAAAAETACVRVSSVRRDGY